jgi:hypothetical protein
MSSSQDAMRRLGESLRDPRAVHAYQVVVSAVDPATSTCTVDDGTSGTLTAVPYIGAAPTPGQAAIYFVTGDSGVVMGGGDMGLTLYHSVAHSGTPPVLPPILVQTGQAIIQVDSTYSGFVFPFPRPFPRGLISIQLLDGDVGSFNHKTFALFDSATTLSGTQISVRGSAGEQVPAGTHVRFNYTLIGW